MILGETHAAAPSAINSQKPVAKVLLLTVALALNADRIR